MKVYFFTVGWTFITWNLGLLAGAVGKHFYGWYP